jgi:DNA repair exonuclease SbcCD ATPase subunit
MDKEVTLIDELRTRVRELEDKVEALRISRRVLMTLIDSLEKDKKDSVSRLTDENERLQRNNSRYARTIMCRNIRIIELENQLRSITNGRQKPGKNFTC